MRRKRGCVEHSARGLDEWQLELPQTDADMREAELNDALTSAFSVPEVGDFLKELQTEILDAAAQVYMTTWVLGLIRLGRVWFA